MKTHVCFLCTGFEQTFYEVATTSTHLPPPDVPHDMPDLYLAKCKLERRAQDDKRTQYDMEQEPQEESME